MARLVVLDSGAGNQALDVDAILAAQALSAGGPGDSIVVATVNVRHLSRFRGVEARQWNTIVF